DRSRLLHLQNRHPRRTRVQRQSHPAGVRRLRRSDATVFLIWSAAVLFTLSKGRRFSDVSTKSIDVFIGALMAEGKVKVGIIGSQFQADIHAASFQILSHEAEVVAIASPTPGNAAALAKRYGIPRVFTDSRDMLKERDIEMVTIAAPNSLHAQMTKDIAAAGKHIV